MPPIAHRLTHAAHAKQHGKKQQQQLQQQANKRKSHSLTPPRAYIIIYSIQFDSIRYTQVLCTPRTKTSIFSFSPYEFICPSALNVTNIINTTFSTPRLVPFSCFSLVFLPSNFNENSSSLVIFFFVHLFRLLCKHTHSSCVIENFRWTRCCSVQKSKWKWMEENRRKWKLTRSQRSITRN